MTQVLWPGSLGAVDKEEDLKLSRRHPINPPPEDACCDVCGRHMSKLKPFGGPGDPLVGDFSGELLVKTWRPAGPHDEEAEKALKEAEHAVPSDPLSWLIAKYGTEKAEEIDFITGAYDCVGESWECRDCIVLGLDEYFETLNKRYQRGNE